MPANYTPEQIGEIDVAPITPKTKSRYSLCLMQPGNQEIVTVIEPCEWGAGRARVLDMVARGVDPGTLYCVVRPDGCLDTEGLRMSNLSRALWWTWRDQAAWESAQPALDEETSA